LTVVLLAYRQAGSKKTERSKFITQTHMSTARALPRESWKAMFVVGILFPLHILLGIASLPLLAAALAAGSRAAWAFALVYAPFYFYPAQTKFPGWKANL